MALDTLPESATPSFYITGGTLPVSASSYVERHADKDLLESLLRGEFCYVLNTRQMGKSSLMVRTATKLRQAGVAVAVLDLTAIGQNLHPEQWYSGLLTRLGQQLDLEDELEAFWEGHEKLGPMQRFLASVREVALQRLSGSLVLFVDEIDAVRSLPFSADEFFAGIRECYNRRTQEKEYERLTFCLLGVATPADLITETRMSPFNIGRRIVLTDFTPEEAAPLAEGLASNPSGGELGRVLYWTGGHPYMTQRLCRALAEALADPTTEAHQPTDAFVDALCERLFLSKTARDTDDNLAFVRNRLLRSEVDLAALLDLYVQVRAGKKIKDDETNPLIPVLRLSGVVKLEHGVLKVRNRIYDRVFDREWVIAHMPDAELRRQRAAYRTGVLRTAVVAGAIVLAMGALALTARRQANRANLATLRANDREAQAQRLSTALQQQNGALQSANAAERAATQSAKANAQLASQRAEDLRLALLKTDAARREAADNARKAEFEKGLAIQNSAESRARLIRLNQETGARLENAGDLIGALPWFVEAQKLEGDTPGSRSLFAMRLASILQAAPRLAQAWKHADWASWGTFSQNGQRVVTLGTDGLHVWNRINNTQQTYVRNLPGLEDLVVSDHGNRYLARQQDGTLQAWDMVTGKRVGPAITAAKSTILLLSATGSYAGAFRTGKQEMLVWEVATGMQHTIHLMGNRTITLAEFDPSGAQLALGVTPSDQIQIRESATGKIVTQQATHGGVNLLRYSPDGSTLACMVAGSGSYMGYLWKIGTTELKPLAGAITEFDAQLRFSPDGKRIAGSLGNVVRVWDAETGAAISSALKMDSLTSALIFSPDGRRLAAAGTDRAIRVWDITDGKLACSPLHNEDVPLTLAFSPDGRYLLGGCLNGSVRVWDTLIWNNPGRALENASRMMESPYSPNGKRLLVSLSSRPAGVFDALTGRLALPPLTSEGRVTTAMFHPNGQRIATGDNHGLLQFWDANSGAKGSVSHRFGDGIVSLEFSVDGRRLLLHYQTASNSPTAVDWAQVLDATTLTPLFPPIGLLHIEDHQATTVRFSPDGKRFLILEYSGSGAFSMTLRLCDAKTGGVIARITPANMGVTPSVAFSPDGRLVALSGEDCRIYRVENGAPVGPTLPVRYVSAIVFSPDSRLLATATIDGVVQLWDVRTGRAALPPMAHDKLATQCAFSRDGRLLFVCTLGSLRVWDALTGQLVALLTDNNAFQFALSPDQVHVTMLGPAGIRVLELPHDTHSLVDATALSELLTCARMEDGWQQPLGSDALLRRWHDLQARHPDDFTLPQAQALARYSEKATQYLDASLWEEALPYLNARVEASPQNMGFREQRSLANAALKRWKEVIADLETAVQHDPKANLTTWHNLALAYLAAGDTAGYHRTCEALWKLYGPQVQASERSALAWTFHLGPGALDDYSGILGLLEKDRAQLQEADKMSLGALYYRAGRYKDCIQIIQPIVTGSPGAYFDAPLYLAMAYEQLGQKTEARQYLAQGQGNSPNSPDATWALKTQFQLQLREARTLLNMP